MENTKSKMYELNPFVFGHSKCVNIKVVDGDTFHCKVLHILDDNVTVAIQSTIRLHRVDASEKNTSCGWLMKEVLTKLMNLASNVKVMGIKKDLYGRILGEVFITLPYGLNLVGTNNEYNLSDLLLEKGVVCAANKRLDRSANEIQTELINIQAFQKEVNALNTLIINGHNGMA